jgi:hypothetical protein
MRPPLLFASLSLSALTLGCTHLAGVTHVPPDAPPLLQTVGKACKSLCIQDVTATEVARSLGRIDEDYGAPLQVLVTPSDPRFSSLEVLRDGVTRSPVSVWLQVDEKQPLPMTQAAATFGPLEETPRQTPNGHYGVVFEQVIQVASSCVCRLTADVHPGRSGIKDGAVVWMKLRRGEL